MVEDTLDAKGWLGNIRQCQGELDAARAVLEEVVAGFKAVPGNEESVEVAGAMARVTGAVAMEGLVGLALFFCCGCRGAGVAGGTLEI